MFATGDLILPCIKTAQWRPGDPCVISLQWHHNECDGISNHQPHHCLLKRLFRRRSKKTSKLCVIGLYAGNSPVTTEFPSQMASNVENVSIMRVGCVCICVWTRLSIQILNLKQWFINSVSLKPGTAIDSQYIYICQLMVFPISSILQHLASVRCCV